MALACTSSTEPPAAVLPGDAGMGPPRSSRSEDGGLDRADAEPDAEAPEAEHVNACEANAAGYYALQTTLDVWWQGTPTTDPGRGRIVVHTLIRRVAARADRPGRTELKLCGLELPVRTSDVYCEAYTFELPSTLWDAPDRPWVVHESLAPLEPGRALGTSELTSFVGVNTGDAPPSEPWPELVRDANNLAHFVCGAGTGAACLTDDDDDGEPGVTLRVAHDGAIHVSPVGDGSCTSRRRPFRRGRLPTSIALGSGTYDSASDRIFVALAVRPAAELVLLDDCASLRVEPRPPRYQLRTAGCTSHSPAPDPHAPPQDLVPNDARPCSAEERVLVEETMPVYRSLASGEAPGEAWAPLGWTSVEPPFDIGRSASEGPVTEVVRLGDLSSEPSCADVRGAAFAATGAR